MTSFDKLCVVLTVPFGVLLLVFGAIGTFAGFRAAVTLPPVLGFAPFFVGWAMSVTLIRAWRRASTER